MALIKLTINMGEPLPSATIDAGDSVFWFNNTSESYRLVYNQTNPSEAIRWGTPPDPLPPQGVTSQVVFPGAETTEKFVYTCLDHPDDKGTITVNAES